MDRFRAPAVATSPARRVAPDVGWVDVRPRVRDVPPDTRLLPGHGDVGTLEDELQTNPYVRAVMGLEEGVAFE